MSNRAHKRLAVWLAILLVVAGGALAHVWHIRALEAELRAFADARGREQRADSPSLHFRYATTAVVSKDYVVFGPATGKATLFVAQAPGADAPISGYEFFFERRDGAWRKTDSGHCSGEACRVQGRRLLAELDARLENEAQNQRLSDSP